MELNEYPKNILPGSETVQVMRQELIDLLPPPIIDIEAWCITALEEAVIGEVDDCRSELFLSFAATLGEMAAKKAGIDLTPLEDRGI